MQSESLMLYKLIILYILDRMDFPITNTELTSFILEKEYANYITIQQTLEDLIEDGYIAVEHSHNTFLYRITPSGRETLSFFYTKGVFYAYSLLTITIGYTLSYFTLKKLIRKRFR